MLQNTSDKSPTCHLAQLQLGEDTLSKFTTKLGKMNKEKQANMTTELQVTIYAKEAQPPCFQAQLRYQKKRKPQLNACCSIGWLCSAPILAFPQLPSSFPTAFTTIWDPSLFSVRSVPTTFFFHENQRDSFTHIEALQPCTLCDNSNAINQFYESIWLA